MVIPYKLFLFLSNILLLSSLLGIHTQQPWQPSRVVNFSPSTVSTSSRGDPIIHHMMGCHSIYLLIHGIFHHFFLYSYSKPSITLIYESAAIWFYCAKLDTCCTTVSSASVHTSQKTHPRTRATMLVTQLFLLPQQVSHKENSSIGKHNSHQGATDM
jgi:hypothetical protein